MLVPYYDNKKSTDYTYENNPYLWIDLKVYLDLLSEEILSAFGEYNGLTADGLEQMKQKAKSLNYPPISIADKLVPFDEFIVNAKLFFETGWTCEYGLWKLNTGLHHGIDLIMPKGTPIESFSDGKVIKLILEEEKTYYGNCVVIESVIGGQQLYFSYFHLDSINVKLNQQIKQGDIIGTCGNTGNSTGYHLHFQIDKKASFHPFYSKNLDDIKKFTINPWSFLQKHYKVVNKDSKGDLLMSKPKLNTNKSVKSSVVLTNNKLTKHNPEKSLIDDILNKINKPVNNTDYITFFQRAGIIKGEKNDLKLDYPLTRYQFTLILYRLKKAGLLKLSDKKCKFLFKDIKNLDKEFYKALEFTVCNGILHGDKDRFYPWSFVNGVQFLAVIGRLFGNLSDGKGKNWYTPYLNWAKENKLIPTQWQYLFKPLPRKLVFNILGKLIFGGKLV